MCARTLNGQVQYVVWTGHNAKPAYGTPGVSGSFAIPADYDVPGKAGWWIGHVPPGDTAKFSGLRTRDLDRSAD
jgi:hypothetical protein